MSNLSIVEDFLAAFNRGDIDYICAAFTKDAIYHNMPREPQRGREFIMKGLAEFVRSCSDIHWVTHHIAESSSGAVLTERTDQFRRNGQQTAVQVMGLFELVEGKISAWREYYDPNKVHPRAVEAQLSQTAESSVVERESQR